jgi:signal transduction histidine kinase
VVGLTSTDFGDVIATKIQSHHRSIAERWLERLVVLLPVDAIAIFPSDQMLDHIPALIAELAEYLRVPEDQAIAANAAVVMKAAELGKLRHAQRASVHQLLREYQLLGAILAAFVQEQTALLELGPTPLEAMALLTRLHAGVGVLQQTTVDTFVAAYTDTIRRQTDRLGSFNRLVSHELRQPLSALQAAVELLKARHPSEPSATDRPVAIIDRNVVRLIDLTRQLEAVSRLRDDDNVNVQTVDVSAVALDVARQLREMSDVRGVRLRIAPDLGSLTIDVARVELVLINLMSNAVKYSDPSKAERVVDVRAADVPNGDGIAIDVRDNGIGIDAAHIDKIFNRFFRVHTSDESQHSTSGLGLGLSIVKECIDALHGSISVESTIGEGTAVTLRLPSHLYSSASSRRPSDTMAGPGEFEQASRAQRADRD